MRYIRFLKTPRILSEKGNPSKSHIYALITITSDLGDSFLPCDLTLSAELHASDTSNASEENILVWRTIHWTAGMRSLPIILPLSQRRTAWPVRVRVGVSPKTSTDEFEMLYEADARGVVSAWSAPLDPTKGVKEAVKLVERRFGAVRSDEEDEPLLCVWEETGESIARHLWDAGITMSCHIRSLAEKADPKWLQTQECLRVLELGTGCGINMSNAEVILTDLPEAADIVERNIGHATPATGSTVRFAELDWDASLPPDLFTNSTSEDHESREITLIVAADCTYNPDSSPALVNTMRRLAATSPNAIILIAMKKRHSSEEIFFELMSNAGFDTANSTEIVLPGDEMAGEETVFVYQYGWNQTASK